MHENNKNGKNNKKEKKHKSCHHIFPTSRFPELASVRWNKVNVNQDKHNTYHYFFNNSTPVEIIDKVKKQFSRLTSINMIDELNRCFWGEIFEINIEKNNIKIKLKRKYRKVFKDKVKNSDDELRCM